MVNYEVVITEMLMVQVGKTIVETLLQQLDETTYNSRAAGIYMHPNINIPQGSQ